MTKVHLHPHEHSWLEEAVYYWRKNCKDVCDDIDNEGTNLSDVVDRLKGIVIDPKEEEN
jgi:hypothetical protein